MFLSLESNAQTKTLRVTPGNLSTLLGSETNSITNLILSGAINGTDIGKIRTMSHLSVLNLTNVKIVTGGGFVVNGNNVSVMDNQIPNDMLNQLTNIQTVVIPQSVTSIGHYAFYECSGLSSVIIPNSVTSIGECAFHDCSNLSSVSIGSGLATISQTAFCGSIKLKDFIVSASNLTYYSVNGILYNKNRTKLIHYPNAMSSSFTIPTRVTAIDGHAFCGCKDLKSITIPSLAKSIGEEAFCDCSSLCEIHCYAITPPVTSLCTFSNVSKSSCILYVPKGTVAYYKASLGWGEFLNINEDLPTSITDLESKEITVYSKPDAILIKGAEVGISISIYNLFGTLLKTVIASNEDVTIDVPAHQIYLVKIDTKQYKIAL